MPSINLVTWSGSTVTPVDDAIIYERFEANSGIIDGCEVTIKDSATLHINSGHGIICGRKFTVTDSDIPVELSSSGTLLGRLYVHMDLSSISAPIELLIETGASLTAEQQDSDINVNSGVWEINLATFTVDTVTIDDLETIDNQVAKNGTAVAQIEDKTKAQNAYGAGEYLIFKGILRKTLTSISIGTDLVEGVNIEATDVASELSSVANSMIEIPSFTIPSGVQSYTLNNANVEADSKVSIWFDDDDVETVSDAGCHAKTYNGYITFTFDSALSASVSASGIIYNV